MLKQAKKFIVVILIASVLFPARSHAIFGLGDIVFDPANLAKNAISALKATASYVLEYEGWVKEYVLDPLAYAVAQQSAFVVVNDTLRWAQEGEGNGVGFITDFGNYYEDIGDEEVNQAIDALLASGNPYADLMAKALVLSRNSKKASPTITGYDLDRWGGPEGFNETPLTLSKWFAGGKLANSPIGSTIQVINSVNSDITEQETIAKDELQSSAFTPKKECVEEDDNGNCIREEIVTDSETVSYLVQRAVGTPLDRINAADELSEIVAAAFGSFMNALFLEGLNRIATYSSDEINSGLRSRNPIGGPEDADPGDWLNTPDVIVDLENEIEPWIEKLNLVIEYYEGFLSSSSSGLAGLANDLDKCWPGPDYGWGERLQLYLSDISQDLSGSSANSFAQDTEEAANEENQMTNDPLVNIPGLNTVSALISANTNTNIDTETTINREQLAKWKTALWTLMNIKTDIRTAARIARPAESWILFSDDWDNLSSFEKGNVLSSAGLENTGNDEINKNAVLSYYWDLWAEVVDDETKNSIRSDFYALKNSGALPSPNIITSAQGKANTNTGVRQALLDATEDCETLRDMAVGNNMNDTEIYGFLVGERSKQESGVTSVFATDIFTNELAIKNSILSDLVVDEDQLILECSKPTGYDDTNNNLTTTSQLFEVGQSIFGSDFYNKVLTGTELSNASKTMRDALEARFDNVFVPWTDRDTRHVDAVCLRDSSSGPCQVVDFCRDCSGSVTLANMASRMQFLEDPTDQIQCIDDSSTYAGDAFDKYSSDSNKQVKNANSIYKIFTQDSRKQLFCRLTNVSYGGVKPVCNPSGFEWYTNNQTTPIGSGGFTCAGTEDPYDQVCILECNERGNQDFNGNVRSVAQSLIGDEWNDPYYHPEGLKLLGKLVRDAIEEDYENVFVPWIDSNTRHFDAFCILTNDVDEYGYKKCYVRDFLVSSSESGGVPSEQFVNVSTTAPTDDVIYCSNYTSGGGSGDGADNSNQGN